MDGKELYELLGDIETYCHKHGFQCCSLCPSMSCGDNTNPLVAEIKKLRANPQTAGESAPFCLRCGMPMRPSYRCGNAKCASWDK